MQHLTLEGGSGAGAVLEGTESFGPARAGGGACQAPWGSAGSVLGAAAVLPFEHLAWEGCGKEAEDQP